MIDDLNLQEATAQTGEFRAACAKNAAWPLDEFLRCQLKPDEPQHQTWLMRIACEVLLRVTDLTFAKRVLADETSYGRDEDWLVPIKKAIIVIEAEDSGEIVIS